MPDAAQKKHVAGPGRPALPEAERRTRTIGVRVTDAEYDELRANAELVSSTLSEYGRAALLGFRVRAKADDEAIHKLNRIGVNLNQLTRVANATGRIREAEALQQRLLHLGAILERLT